MEEKKEVPTILVGTPTATGNVCSEYLLGALESSLPRHGDRYNIGFLIREGGSHIAKARDNMLMTFYMHTNAEYLLFIDSDQGFSSSDIKSLLDVIAAGYDIAAAPVPKKQVDHRAALLSALEMFSNGEPPTDNLLAGGYEYNLVLEDPKDKGRIREVRSIGTGMMLISRKVVKTMIKKELVSENQYLFPDKFGVDRFVPSLFATVFWDGGYLGEDFAFCHRARKAKLKIGVDTALKIEHVGKFNYEGDYPAFERVKAILNESNPENAPNNGNEKTS